MTTTVTEFEAYSTPDEWARNVAREARLEELRQRSGWYECDELKVPSPVKDTPMGDPWWYGFEAPELVAAYDEDDAPLVSRETLRRDEDDLAWLLRDRLDDEAEARRRAVEGRRASGTEYPVGWQGEFEWLSEVVAQLRVEYKAQLTAAMRQRRVSAARAREFAQLKAIERRVASLKARYNVRRYIEALGGDPDSYRRRDSWIAEEAAWREAVETLDADYYRDGVAAEGLLAR